MPMSSSAHGMVGRRASPRKSSARPPTAKATVRGLVWPSSPRVVQTRWAKWPDGDGTPSIWGSSPAITTSPRPKLKPTMTGREMKSVTQPSRRMPNSANQSPATNATPLDSAIARPGSSCPGSPATTAPDISATVEVGPIATCREDPNTAYNTSAAGSA